MSKIFHRNGINLTVFAALLVNLAAAVWMVQTPQVNTHSIQAVQLEASQAGVA